VVGHLVVASGLLAMLAGAVGASNEASVHRVEIHDEIDLGLAPYLDRALEQAEAQDAAAVLIDIDTPGGRLDAVLQMRDALLRTPVPTIAFVDTTAFSAGALVALASEQIHMTSSAVMGAATPVDGGTGAPADPKVVSAVRSTFRATAEQRGRDPEVAEAMVDPDVEVEGLVAAGELLSLTASEALEWEMADAISADTDEVLAAAGLGDATLVASDPSLAERLVRFITNPVLASLLLTLGMWLVVGDLLSGGVGVPAAVGAGLLAVFFWGHLLAGLAGWEDVALVVVGLVLILVELLVVPGFGIPGILGLAALLGGSFLAMLNRDFDFVEGSQMVRAGTVVGVSFAAIVVGTIAMLVHLSRSSGPPGLVLAARLGGTSPVTERASGGWLRWFGSGGGVLASERQRPDPEHDGPSDAPRRLPHGTRGVALTDLRPSGVVEIEGERVDVVSEGGWIRGGDQVEVVRDEGYRRVVRRAGPDPSP
jgi:membrane-bound serine protease (ClpP class)